MPDVNAPTVCFPPLHTPMHTGQSVREPDPGSGDQGLCTTPWIAYFNCLSRKSGIPGLYLSRSILPGVQTVGSDVLANRYNFEPPPGYRADLFGVRISVKTNALASTYVVDILVSTDQGISWNSLFPTGIANKPTLPVLTETITLTPTFAVPSLFDGNQLRVDVLQADGNVSGVDLLLAGLYVPAF